MGDKGKHFDVNRFGEVFEGATPQEAKLARIAAARQELAAAYAANPERVLRFNARMARIAAARKREQQRIDHLVLGHSRPVAKATVHKAKSRRRPKTVDVPVELEPGIEEAVALREAWDHKAYGTPETWDQATRTHSGALAQLHANGVIDKDQLEWVAQIANVYRSLEADVGVKIASLEARVDTSSRPQAVAERIHRVRMHRAYGYWRDMIPAPKALVLDMVVGDAIGFTVAAKRYRVHNRKAKRLLLEAINRWPVCVAHAFSAVDQAMVDAMNEARAPLGVRYGGPPIILDDTTYDQARHAEHGREQTDEPYLLPPVDPAFLDEDGRLREWSDIAAIIRERINAVVEESA